LLLFLFFGVNPSSILIPFGAVTESLIEPSSDAQNTDKPVDRILPSPKCPTDCKLSEEGRKEERKEERERRRIESIN
jgi:hypothetical protein